MRLKSILVFFLIGISVVGCKKVDKLTQFEMDYSETVVVPSTIGFQLPFDIYTPKIETDSETQFSINNTRKDLVEQIILKSLVLSITSPENKDFSFLESIEVYVEADGLSEVMVAWKYEIPNDVDNVLELETTGDDLKEYIKKDTFSLKVVTVTDELISVDHYIDVDALFFVDAKILGI